MGRCANVWLLNSEEARIQSHHRRLYTFRSYHVSLKLRLVYVNIGGSLNVSPQSDSVAVSLHLAQVLRGKRTIQSFDARVK